MWENLAPFFFLENTIIFATTWVSLVTTSVLGKKNCSKVLPRIRKPYRNDILSLATIVIVDLDTISDDIISRRYKLDL